MKDEKRVEESVITPAESAEPKKRWQKPDLQKLRVSLDTASDFGSGGDGLSQSTLG